jgi:crotonobetainyl-CoA:carnitine CoA-transferase CaiB-like acyl-CoA transferase
MTTSGPPLAGVRIVECSLLGPAAITTNLADLGADVIKVESPTGDYVREMTWPIVEGTSLMHLHVNRGKRSIVLDLKSDDGKATFVELAASADAVVEAMRPGVLDKLGIGYSRLREVNPKVVFCTISGYGMTGPYKNLPSHGIAYDTWAGIVNPAYDDEGFCYIPSTSRSASTPVRSTARSASWPASCAPARRARAARWSSPSPTRQPPSTGIAPRPGEPTSAPSPR